MMKRSKLKIICIFILMQLILIPILIAISAPLMLPKFFNEIIERFILSNKGSRCKVVQIPTSINHDVENLYLETEDDHQIGCFLVQPMVVKNNHKSLILIHGNGCNRDDLLFLIDRQSLLKNFIVLFPDIRSYGDSEGDFSAEGGNLDIQACVRFMKSRFDREVFIVGFSLGGAIALEYGRFQSEFYPDLANATTVQGVEPQKKERGVVPLVEPSNQKGEIINASEFKNIHGSTKDISDSPNKKISNQESLIHILPEREATPENSEENIDSSKKLLGVLIHTDIDNVTAPHAHERKTDPATSSLDQNTSETFVNNDQDEESKLGRIKSNEPQSSSFSVTDKTESLPHSSNRKPKNKKKFLNPKVCTQYDMKASFRAEKLVIVSGFSSMKNIVNDFLIFRVAKFFAPSIEKQLEFYNSLENIKKINKERIILIHSSGDTLIDKKHALALQRVSDVVLHILPNLSHCDTISSTKTWGLIFNFLIEDKV